MDSTLTDLESPSTRTGRRRGRKLLLWGVVACVLATIAFMLHWQLVGSKIQKTNNAFLQADAVIVAPKIGGYVSEVLVRDNQAVKPGQPLVAIDAAPYQAAFDLAQAEAAERRADLARIRAEIRRQQAVAAEAAADVRVASTSAALARTDAGRYERLAATGAEAAQRRDQAFSERDVTAGKLVGARAAAESAARQTDALQAQLGQGQAALLAAEAKARRAANDLEGAKLESPIAGVVGDRTVRVGQFVQPGTRLMTVVPTQDIYLVANFKETQLRRMRPGQPATVRIDAFPDLDLKGVVDSLAPGTGAEFALLPPENATGNFTKIVQRVPVRIRLEARREQRALLRPGLSAEVSVDTRRGGGR